ncbi:MAG TPA: hypothetical protein VFM82_01210 [Flavobacteriaceae bacterium]|nr:hypothetical protein [Flavobacteriaceae bacterium]
MASKKHLKRDLNYVMGDIIEAALIYQMAHPEADKQKSEEIVDGAIAAFDELNAKINERKVENKGKQLKEVNKEMETKAKSLIEKLNTL